MNKEELIKDLSLYNKELEELDNVLNDLKYHDEINKIKIKLGKRKYDYYNEVKYNNMLITINNDILKTLLKTQQKITEQKYNETLDKLKSGS